MTRPSTRSCVEIVAGHAGLDREGGRDRHRPHLALADDPRRARLPGRHPRPAAAQAHRPVVLRAGAPGRPRLPDRDDARRATSSSTTTSTCPRAASATCPTCASPCRCSSTPRGPRWSRSCRRSATTTTSAARCPARCRRTATSVFEEGLMVPPIKLWDQGVPNEAALTIMTRNSRMPDSLAADLDAECSACLMGARRLGELFDRYGRDDGRGLLRRDPRPAPPRSSGARSCRKIPDGTLRLGGLRRARRRRRAAAARASGSR